MTKYILALCAIASLTSCSGHGKAGYVLEGDWDYEGWRHSTGQENEDLANVEFQTEDTYTVSPGGCVG